MPTIRGRADRYIPCGAPRGGRGYSHESFLIGTQGTGCAALPSTISYAMRHSGACVPGVPCRDNEPIDITGPGRKTFVFGKGCLSGLARPRDNRQTYIRTNPEGAGKPKKRGSAKQTNNSARNRTVPPMRDASPSQPSGFGQQRPQGEPPLPPNSPARRISNQDTASTQQGD